MYYQAHKRSQINKHQKDFQYRPLSTFLSFIYLFFYLLVLLIAIFSHPLNKPLNKEHTIILEEMYKTALVIITVEKTQWFHFAISDSHNDQTLLWND